MDRSPRDTLDLIADDIAYDISRAFSYARTLWYITMKIDSGLTACKDKAMGPEEARELARRVLEKLPRNEFYSWLLAVNLDEIAEDPRFRSIKDFKDLLEEHRKRALRSGVKPRGLPWLEEEHEEAPAAAAEEQAPVAMQPSTALLEEESSGGGGAGKVAAAVLVLLLAAAAALLFLKPHVIGTATPIAQPLVTTTTATTVTEAATPTPATHTATSSPAARPTSTTAAPAPLVVHCVRRSFELALGMVNETVVEIIGTTIYGGRKPASAAEAVWEALEWVDENMEYDYRKKALIESGVAVEPRSPLETLKLRRGVCEDYAVLLATALLYANVSHVYLLAFNSYDHVAAAATVDGAVFVLDQHLPPIELQDYIQYILAGNPGEIEAYEAKLVNDRVVLERRYVEAFIDRDSYPEDKLPPDIAQDVARALTELYPNLEVEPRLQCFTETRLGPLWIIKEPKTKLEGLQPTGLFKLYSPILRDRWIHFLADLISKELGDQLASNKYVWIQVVGDELVVALTPYKPPEVKIKQQGSTVVVEVRSAEPISTISILFYKQNTTSPVLGVAPRNARYPGIMTIHAQEYTVSGATAHIEFNAMEVNNALPPGSYVLAVWVNNKLAYTCKWKTT